MSVLKRWWPLPVAVAVAVVVQQLVLGSRYDVGGHAGEHLGSASFVFPATVVASVFLWTTPATRRSPIVLIGLAGWLGAGVAILVGNVRVVEALIDSGQSRASTDTFVASPAIDDAHWLADTAPYVAVAAGLLVTLGLYLVRAVSRRTAIICGVLTAIFPPWLLPGFGVVVMAVARCVARERDARRAGPALAVT